MSEVNQGTEKNFVSEITSDPFSTVFTFQARSSSSGLTESHRATNGKSDIRLESFLISQTYRHQLRWPSQVNPKKDAMATDYRDHHILCAKDDPATYVRDLIAALLMRDECGVKSAECKMEEQ